MDRRSSFQRTRTLANSLVNKDAGSYGNVERLDGTKHGDADPLVAQRQIVVTDALVLSTLDNANRCLIVGLRIIVIALLVAAMR